MGVTADIKPTTSKAEQHSTFTSNENPFANKKNKRGRPKGARTTRLSDVRKQAAEERKKLRADMGAKIDALQAELNQLKQRYERDTTQLTEELELLRRREVNYQQALKAGLHKVAAHLHNTLVNWGTAELEEAQVDKRGRGRPRKTLK